MNCAAAVGTGVGVRVAVGGTAVGVRVAVGVGGTGVAVLLGVGGTGVAVLPGVGVVGTAETIAAGVGLGVSVKSRTATVGIAVTVGGIKVSVASGVTLGVAVASGVIPAMGVEVLPGGGDAVLVAGGLVFVGSATNRVGVGVAERKVDVGRGVEVGPTGGGAPMELAPAIGVMPAAVSSSGESCVDASAGVFDLLTVSRAIAVGVVGAIFGLASCVAVGTRYPRIAYWSGCGNWSEPES